MLTVAQAAEELGITQTRVRALLAKGQIVGHKMSRTWVVDGESVALWKATPHRPGRPSLEAGSSYEPCHPNATEAHRLYQECKRTLAGCYSSAFLDQAQSEEEELFWVLVSDFFLEREQMRLVEGGAF